MELKPLSRKTLEAMVLQSVVAEMVATGAVQKAMAARM